MVKVAKLQESAVATLAPNGESQLFAADDPVLPGHPRSMAFGDHRWDLSMLGLAANQVAGNAVLNFDRFLKPVVLGGSEGPSEPIRLSPIWLLRASVGYQQREALVEAAQHGPRNGWQLGDRRGLQELDQCAGCPSHLLGTLRTSAGGRSSALVRYEPSLPGSAGLALSPPPFQGLLEEFVAPAPLGDLEQLLGGAYWRRRPGRHMAGRLDKRARARDRARDRRRRQARAEGNHDPGRAIALRAVLRAYASRVDTLAEGADVVEGYFAPAQQQADERQFAEEERADSPWHARPAVTARQLGGGECEHDRVEKGHHKRPFDGHRI